jgi:hypothetical protein
MYQYIVGGLGIQLFQYSMLHYIQNLRRLKRARVWIDKSPRSGRPFLIGKLLENCNHVSSVGHPYSNAQGKVSRLLDILPEFSLASRFKINQIREAADYAFV